MSLNEDEEGELGMEKSRMRIRGGSLEQNSLEWSKRGGSLEWKSPE